MTAMRLHRYPSPSGGIALGKMGVGATMLKQGKTARDYVQDGLIAMWDGIENAGWGVHDATATTWNELVSDTALALASGVSWTANSATASGLSRTWATFETNTTLGATIDAALSLTAVFKTSDTSNLQFVLLDTLRRDCLGIAPNALGIGLRQAIPLTTASGKVWSLTANYASSSAQTSDDAYVDGTANSDRGYANFSNPMTASIAIGGGYNSGWFSGEIYNLRVYSRALTADEIARNYAIDKERFNLP